MYAISAATLFDGTELRQNHSVLVQGENIAQLCPTNKLPSDVPTTVLTEGILAPGFVDLQVNGGGGVLLNNSPDIDSVNTMAAAHRSRGTTSLLPTVISDTPEKHTAAAQAVSDARKAGNKSVLGIHIEGPFFEPSKRGAHHGDMIRPMEQNDVDWLTSLEDMKVLVTLAPERVVDSQIQQLTRAGLCVFAGHTSATSEQVETAIAAGLRGFTHLFNAMEPLTAREPGTIGAALSRDDTWASLIADGHHVSHTNIQLALKAKPKGKLFFVSDAMATAGSSHSHFEMYGERIEEQNGRLINTEGVLAGSAITLIDSVRLSRNTLQLPLEECLKMASLYPAQCLGLGQQLGRLQTGYRADMVHFNSDHKILGTWVAGEFEPH